MKKTLVSKPFVMRDISYADYTYISYVDLLRSVCSCIAELGHGKKYLRIIQYRLSMYTSFMPITMLDLVENEIYVSDERKCTEPSYVYFTVSQIPTDMKEVVIQLLNGMLICTTE